MPLGSAYRTRAEAGLFNTPDRVAIARGPVLTRIQTYGAAGLSEKYLELLQDAGWIDHKDNLTERGRLAVEQFLGRRTWPPTPR